MERESGGEIVKMKEGGTWSLLQVEDSKISWDFTSTFMEVFVLIRRYVNSVKPSILMIVTLTNTPSLSPDLW